MDIRLRPGERGLLVGQTGSGKTANAAWQARTTQQKPVVIMDTKIEPLFRKIARPDESTDEVDSRAGLTKLLKLRGNACPDYILVRPALTEMADPESLDEYLLSVNQYGSGAYVLIDEAYQLHNGGRAGPGLIGLLTRGRSRGISTLLCSQRPAWLSRFCLTETQKIYIYWLADRADTRRLAQVVPGLELRKPIDKPYHFVVYVNGKLLMYAPVPLLADMGYVPDEPSRRWF